MSVSVLEQNPTVNRTKSGHGTFSIAHRPADIAVEALQSSNQLESLRAEWIALADRLRAELPFNTHQWMAAWWQNLRRANRLTRDAMCVLAFRRDGQLIAVAPYMVTSRHVMGLPVLRVLQPIGTDPNITEVRCMLVAPQDEHTVTMALVAHALESIACDAIVVSGLEADGEASRQLVLTKGAVESTPTSMYVIDLPATWDELRASLPRNIRESLRKCRNSLARDGHEPTFKVLRDANEIIALLPRFFDLHRNRSEAAGTIHHRDVFGRECDRQFVVDAINTFAALDRAYLFTMEIAGETVAMRLAFACNDCLYLYYSGYDFAWSKYSVMTSVTSEAIQYAIDAGFKRVNLSTGADQSKLRWRPREVPTRTVMVQKATLRARLAHRAIEAGRQVRAQLEKRKAAKLSAAAPASPPTSSDSQTTSEN
jgi:CelD/BcsL family acetyltransferase involved in cellulose biosynthesis